MGSVSGPKIWRYQVSMTGHEAVSVNARTQAEAATLAAEKWGVNAFDAILDADVIRLYEVKTPKGVIL